MTDADILGARLTRRPTFVMRKIAGEILLIPVRSDAADLDSFFRVNEVGAFILDEIDGVRTGRDVCMRVSERFEVDRARADRDTREFLGQLASLGFLELGQG